MKFEVSNYISGIHAKGITLAFNKGKIVYNGPEEHITSEFIESLKENKATLVKHLWPSDVNIMPICTDGKKTPLILVHGELLNYALNEHLGNDRPLYGFFHLGSAGEKIGFETVSAYCSDYMAKLDKVVSSTTFFIGGFSFGAILAFEMALRLQKRGCNIPFLALIDIVNPEQKECMRGTNHQGNIFVRALDAVYKQYLRVYYKLRRGFFNAFFLLEAPLPKAFRKEYIQDIYVSRSLRYKPSGKFNGEILLFKASAVETDDDTWGWGRYADKVTTIQLAGNHATIFSEPSNIDILNKTFKQYMDNYHPA